MLLDLDDLGKIVDLYREPLIAPETRWEADEGFRTNVIFPGRLILEDDGTLKLYYGASDTVECMATASCEALVRLCLAK